MVSNFTGRRIFGGSCQGLTLVVIIAIIVMVVIIVIVIMVVIVDPAKDLPLVSREGFWA